MILKRGKLRAKLDVQRKFKIFYPTLPKCFQSWSTDASKRTTCWQRKLPTSGIQRAKTARPKSCFERTQAVHVRHDFRVWTPYAKPATITRSDWLGVGETRLDGFQLGDISQRRTRVVARFDTAKRDEGGESSCEKYEARIIRVTEYEKRARRQKRSEFAYW